MDASRTTAVVCFILIYLTNIGHAITIEAISGRHGNVLYVSGPIERGDDAKFQLFMARHLPVQEVWFRSPGGNLAAGIAMGRLMREARLGSRVPSGAECASACFYAFAGGVVRRVDRGARVGVHMASAALNESFNSALREILLNRNNSPLSLRIVQITMLVEQSSAKAAGRQAVFLISMGISPRIIDKIFDTPHLDVHWLTDRDLIDFNVVNSAPEIHRRN